MTEMVTWLRDEIKRDLLVANMISAGGFAAQRWDTEPPGQVNPEDIPASRQVTEIIGAQHDEVCGWVQIVAYDRLNNEPPERDCRDSTSPMILVDNGRREFEHIIRNDPRNVVARCEAELAILDEHISDGDRKWPDCVRCADTHPDRCECGMLDGRHWRTAQDYPCRTVRLVASGYRHRHGFDPSWLPTSPS